MPQRNALGRKHHSIHFQAAFWVLVGTYAES